MTTMPTGFFWGNSTSSMQTEGFQGVRGKSTYDLKKEAT
ncbi:MAG: glycoside hydrolase family 1 protein, partial [Leuconostoc falkenbergense]